MPAIVTNAEMEDCLREILGREGFHLSSRRAHGQAGVDIVASKGDERYHIEIVGYKAAGPARAKDFYEGFFRTVSRLDDAAKRCVLALSHRATVGLPARAKQHRTAWLRVAEAFPELEIWLVDTRGAESEGLCRPHTGSMWSSWGAGGRDCTPPWNSPATPT